MLADEVLEDPKDAENAVDRAVSNNELNSGSDVLILVCFGQGNVSEGGADVGTEDSMEICGELDSLTSDIEMEEENPESEQESVRSPDGSSVYYSDEDEKVADGKISRKFFEFSRISNEIFFSSSGSFCRCRPTSDGSTSFAGSAV